MTKTARNVDQGDWIVVDSEVWQIVSASHASAWGRDIIAIEYTTPGNPATRRWWFSASDEIEFHID